MTQKRMFKVISPMPTEGGGTYWQRCGIGFINKDNSINIYLDVLPLKQKSDGVTLQIREFTEAVLEAPIPVVLGGQSLVTSGLQILAEAAWRRHDKVAAEYKAHGRARERS